MNKVTRVMVLGSEPSVTFTVVSSPSSASITLSATGYTSVAGTGTASISVKKGTVVSYSISATGYTTKTGTYTVSDTMSTTISLSQIMVTRTVVASPTTATVVLSASGYTSVSGTGSASITVAYGTSVTHTVSCTGYSSSTGSVTITAASSSTVTLTKLSYTRTVTCTNSGATIALSASGYTSVSSTSGSASITVAYGTSVTYTVSLSGYVTQTASTTVTAASSTAITLTGTLYSISFSGYESMSTTFSNVFELVNSSGVVQTSGSTSVTHYRFKASGNTWPTTVTSAAYMFSYATNMTSITLPSSWGTVTDCSYMFRGCSSLKTVSMPSSWGSVTSCYYMFYGATVLATLSALPTSWGSVTSCYAMFYGCSTLASISLPTSWNNVTSSSFMFYSCSSLKTISNIPITYPSAYAYMFGNENATSTASTQVPITSFNKSSSDAWTYSSYTNGVFPYLCCMPGLGISTTLLRYVSLMVYDWPYQIKQNNSRDISSITRWNGTATTDNSRSATQALGSNINYIKIIPSASVYAGGLFGLNGANWTSATQTLSTSTMSNGAPYPISLITTAGQIIYLTTGNATTPTTTSVADGGTLVHTTSMTRWGIRQLEVVQSGILANISSTTATTGIVQINSRPGFQFDGRATWSATSYTNKTAADILIKLGTLTAGSYTQGSSSFSWYSSAWTTTLYNRCYVYDYSTLTYDTTKTF